MTMPGSKRSRPKAPSAGSMYKDQPSGNSAPFSPAPVKYLDSTISKKGGGNDGASVCGDDEEVGTGKCQGM